MIVVYHHRWQTHDVPTAALIRSATLLRTENHLHIPESMTRSDLHRFPSISRISEPIKTLFAPPKSFLESVDINREVEVSPDSIRGWQKQHRCWEGKGPLAALYKELKPKLIRELDQTSTDSNRGVTGPALVYFMVGPSAERGRPVIFIVNGCSSSRKEAKLALQRSGILTGTASDFTLAVLETSPRGKICVVAMENLGTTRLLDSAKHEVYVDTRDEFRSVGMPVYVSNGPNSFRKATANLVSNGRRYAFITAAHALPTTSEQSTEATDSFRNEGEGSSSYEEEDEEEVLGLPEDFDSPGAGRQCGYDTFTDSRYGQYELPRPSETQSARDRSLRLLGRVEQILDDSDCMVISTAVKYTGPAIGVSNPEVEQMPAVRCGSPSKPTVVMALTCHGAIHGLLSDVPSLMMLPGTSFYQAVYTIVCEGEIKMGDCGTMVIDAVTKELYGFIFGYTKVGRIAYMATGEHVISAIQKSGDWKLCGAEPINCKFHHPIWRLSATPDQSTNARFFSDRRTSSCDR
jgi:hypothetical protein